MKILKCHVENFVSYKSLDFLFNDKGLCLINGSTGAGKSTLCDVIPWILFGITAKNGSVDEVLSWNSSATTYGSIDIDTGAHTVSIVRTRKPNDLYYLIDCVWELPKRGKDLQDTQKQINELLGFDSAIYLAASYYHEFSSVAQFFTSPAKQRRQLCENLVDLSKIKTASTKLTELKKQTASQLNANEAELLFLQATIVNINKDLAILSKNQETFEKTQKIELHIKIDSAQSRIFEAKQAILAYEHTIKEQDVVATKTLAAIYSLPRQFCLECNAVKNHPDTVVLTQNLTEIENYIKNLKQEIQMEQATINTNIKELQNLHEKTEIKPYELLIKSKKDEKKNYEIRLEKLLDINNKELVESNNQELLENIINESRKIIIDNSVYQIEQNTNQLLIDFFDAELSVQFDLKINDKLEITITKNGNKCSFTQLSKGQRQLLKLCFGVSVMRHLQNYRESNLKVVFFDEALDGLSEDFKRKAFNLLNSLQSHYASVFIVEHSGDFKTLCTAQVEIVNEGGVSIVRES